MQRRRFIAQLCGIPVVVWATRVAAQTVDDEEVTSIQSFGYYEGLGPDDTRSSSRTDGTDYDMPCILAEDIAAGVEKPYEFWHGHGGRKHKFVVKPEHFLELQQGRAVEIYTDIVEDHRHSLRISPREPCNSEAC